MALAFGNSTATMVQGLGKFRFADGTQLLGLQITPNAGQPGIDAQAFRDQFLPQLVQARPGYKFEIRMRDSEGWTTLMLDGTLEDMKHDLDMRYADYYTGDVEIPFGSEDIMDMRVYLIPPPVGGCGTRNDNSCLWTAINMARGARKWEPIKISRMKSGNITPITVRDDASFRAYLRQEVPANVAAVAGLGSFQPIAFHPEVFEAVDALLRTGAMAGGSNSWALELLDAGGKQLWGSPRMAKAQFHLRIVLANGHYSLATHALGEGSALSQEYEAAKLAKDPLRVMFSVRRLVARQNESGPRPVRFVPASELPGVSGDDLDELLVDEACNSTSGEFEKQRAWSRMVLEHNAFELTGSMTRFVWHLMADAFGKRWRPVEALGAEESRWLLSSMGCSLTYFSKMDAPAALEGWDQNSSHHAAMVEKIKLPCSAPTWSTLAENYFDSHNFVSLGVYRLQRGPLIQLLSDSTKPWRRYVRSVGSRRAQKMAGLPGSYWTHADINWAIKAGFPRSALRLAADGRANAMVYTAESRSALSSELFGDLIRRVYALRMRYKAANQPEASEFFKLILKKLSGQLATNNYGRFEVGSAENFAIPCSTAELQEIEIEGAGDDMRARGRFRPAAEPLYKSGYARWLPFIQAKSRVNVAQEVLKLPEGACKRLYTDGFYATADSLVKSCKLKHSLDLGAWKMEARGAGQVGSLAKPDLK